MKQNDKNVLPFNIYDYKDKIHNINTDITYMLNRSSAMFDWLGLPEGVPEKELEKILQTSGYAVISKHGERYVATPAGLGGIPNEYGQPTQATINIPYLNINEILEIGKDCVLITNDTWRLGLLPLYTKYTTILNENLISLHVTLTLHRANKIFSCTDSNTKDSIDQYIKKLENGELSTIMDRDMFDSLKVQNNETKEDMNHYIEINQYFKGQLFNEIGLASNYNMKKERLVSTEISENSNNIYPLLDDMYISRLKGVEQLKEVFELDDIEIHFNSSWRNRVDNNISLDKEVSPVNPQPETVNPQPETVDPQPTPVDPQPTPVDPQPETVNPEQDKEKVGDREDKDPEEVKEEEGK